MTVYSFRADDAAPHFYTLCGDCTNKHQLTGERQEATEGRCKACGYGNTHGVDSRIVPVIGRQLEYEAHVDGRYLATFPTRAAAEEIIDEAILGLIEDGLVETLEPA